MCERANKGSGKKITGKANTLYKQGERGRSQTGKGLPCKAGMITEGKNPLPRENLVTHLDKITPYGCASVRVGRPSDTLGVYYTIYYFTDIQEVTTHSAAPSKCIHSSNPKSHKD
jgi:hypothetical protein